MSYEELIVHQSNILKEENGLSDSDYTRTFRNLRLAIHWVVVPPGKRTSIPHAESLEEEFVYVISGNPHAWINGNLYPLRSGHAVGFPAGTGIGHTFINNTEANVILATLGVKAKSDNRFIYMINPELEKEHQKSWWKDWPVQLLGSHNGQPGNLSHVRDVKELSFICHVDEVTRNDSFSYPGDSETFTDGLRLTTPTGLQVLGIWNERLLPGKRSSWPHAHKIEEEFCLILKGNPQVWLNGFVFDLTPGDCVFFPPGKNVAHTLMNNSSETVEFLNIGEADWGGANERLIYPLNSRRNLQCKEKNELWEDAPIVTDLGLHSGKPDAFSS